MRASRLLDIVDCGVLALRPSAPKIRIIGCRVLALRCSTLDIGFVVSRSLTIRRWLRRFRVGCSVFLSFLTAHRTHELEATNEDKQRSHVPDSASFALHAAMTKWSVAFHGSKTSTLVSI